MERLDKLLANTGRWSRKEVKELCRMGRVKVDGAVVKKLAEKYGLVCIDLQQGWDELFEHMHPCNIAWDRIHPNQTGHMYIAKQFLRAVGADRC